MYYRIRGKKSIKLDFQLWFFLVRFSVDDGDDFVVRVNSGSEKWNFLINIFAGFSSRRDSSMSQEWFQR